MNLGDFIRETIRSISSATHELQKELEQHGVLINPPLASSGTELYYHRETGNVLRRVQTIDFDVAVTAASETLGGGKAGLRVLSFEAGAEGKHGRSQEQVSRVRFSIPMVLSPTQIKLRNRAAAEETRRKHEEEIESLRRLPRSPAGY